MIYGHSPREIALGTPPEKIPISLADVLQNMQESAPLCDRLAHCDNVDIVLMLHRLADHARRHTFEDTCLKNVRRSEKHESEPERTQKWRSLSRKATFYSDGAVIERGRPIMGRAAPYLLSDSQTRMVAYLPIKY